MGRMNGELEAHPLRARVLAEVHARPFAPVETPKRILHYAFMTDGEAAQRDREALSAFCASLGLEGPPANAKHHRVAFSGTLLRWESHSEFTTYSWEFGDASVSDAPTPQPFRPAADGLQGVMSLVPQPGPLMVSIDLHLVPAASVPNGPQAIFAETHLAASTVENGVATVATDFRTDAHGFVRILVVDDRMERAQAGAIIQRVLEIETYRTLTLLGLPEAQAIGPSVRRIETELPRVMDAMERSDGLENNRQLLDRITRLAAELETGAAGALFRFGATRAYSELVRIRLAALEEKALPGFDSWSEFLDRRLQPAIRTCSSMEERQANLSRKLTRAAQLLRTRIDIELESQNRDLLRAMNERARIQLRLQQTVEGLSAAAITYYITGLIFYVLRGLKEGGVAWLNPYVGAAIAVPLVLIGILLLVRRLRRRHMDEEAAEEAAIRDAVARERRRDAKASEREDTTS
ncbi:DUF3422 domain-containing protein [Salinarimonas sp.]|uniref:DUF3422 family protein n=1 Tax=Salinarimonas sp. TaxID=2766526 RepID=UPI0032D926D6